MMALCVVANGWSDNGGVLTGNLPDSGADVAQKRVNDLNEDSISKRSKNGSPIFVNTPPPYNNGNDSSQTLTPGPQPSEENSNTTQLLKSPSFSDMSSLEDSEDESDSSLEDSEDESGYAWLDHLRIPFHVKGIPTNHQARIAAQIIYDSSKDFKDQMGSVLLSDLPESAIREILKANLEEILNMSDEDFAQNLAYPLIKRLNILQNDENLNRLKEKVWQVAFNLGIISDDVKEGDYAISLRALLEYANN